MHKVPNKMDKFHATDTEVSDSEESSTSEVAISKENHETKLPVSEKTSKAKMPPVVSATSIKEVGREVLGSAVIHTVQSVMETVKEVAQSTIDMIEFTIKLTERSSQTSATSEETIVDATESDPNCQCVCHPGNCTCKPKPFTGLSKEELNVLIDAMEPQPMAMDQECKCLKRRMELELQQCVEACVENCNCHCHQVEVCTGTCAAHCPVTKHETEKSAVTKESAKESPSALPEPERPEDASKSPSGKGSILNRLSCLKTSSASSETSTEQKSKPELVKKEEKSVTDAGESSDADKGNIFKRLSNSIRRSK